MTPHKPFQDFVNELGDRWRQHAACHDTDITVFFPVTGPNLKSDIATAKQICARCPVQQTCLDYSLQLPYPWHGIYGGLTPRERHSLKYNPTGPIRHGTIAGYFRERKLQLPTCPECREANARATRERRETLREGKKHD